MRRCGREGGRTAAPRPFEPMPVGIAANRAKGLWLPDPKGPQAVSSPSVSAHLPGRRD